MNYDDLIDQLGSRFAKWSLLHESLGTESTKQQEDLERLYQSILTLADNHINTLNNERDALQQQCQQAYKTIVNLKRLMGEYIDDKPIDQDKQPYYLTLDKLNAEKDIVQKHYEKRLLDVHELYQRLEEYQESLGDFVNTELIVRTDIDVSLPTVTALEEEIRRCENEYVKRAQQIDSATEQIKQLWTWLDVLPQSDLDHLLLQLNNNHHEPDKKVCLYATLVQDQYLDKVMQTIAQLEEIKQQREFRKQEITQHLYRLWERLQVDKDERNSFLESNKGVTLEELQQYEMELDRMLKLKSEKVHDFILDARNEMENLWNQLYFSQKERDAFTAFESDAYNDTLLEAHETEIERLKHMVEDRKYILDKVERHMKLLQEIQDFEASTNDPKRLFGKGQRDPGRLLREEKFRKRVSRELPKSKRDLKGALHEFQTSTGTPFTVYGEPYLDQLTEDDKNDSSETQMPPTTPKRLTRTTVRPPMTSPRHRTHANMNFRTPQYNRVTNFQTTINETKNEWRRLESQVSSTASVLHRVRQHNIRKRDQSRAHTSTDKTIKGIKSMDLSPSVKHHQKIQTQRKRISDDISSSSGDITLVEKDYTKNENTAPPNHSSRSVALKHRTRAPKRSLSERHALLFDEDDTTLDLGIFDDGPELSDMSDNEL